MRRKQLAVIGFVLTLGLGACAGGDGDSTAETSATKAGDAAATTSVKVKDFVFAPEDIRVKAGDTVTWTNEDAFDHSVRIDDLDLNGENFGPMTQPVSFSYQFTKPGTYDYLCGVHNSMTGTVVVTD